RRLCRAGRGRELGQGWRAAAVGGADDVGDAAGGDGHRVGEIGAVAAEIGRVHQAAAVRRQPRDERVEVAVVRRLERKLQWKRRGGRGAGDEDVAAAVEAHAEAEVDALATEVRGEDQA